MSRHKASSEILLYAEMVAPSVMRLKDGALLTGFRWQDPDLESSPPELWAAISSALNDALCGPRPRLDGALRNGSDSVRARRPRRLLDPTCRLIDEEQAKTEYFCDRAVALPHGSLGMDEQALDPQAHPELALRRAEHQHRRRRPPADRAL